MTLRLVPMDDLPEWADEWASEDVTHCGQRAVVCSAWGHRVIACSVTGWTIDHCDGTRSDD